MQLAFFLDLEEKIVDDFLIILIVIKDIIIVVCSKIKDKFN